MPALNNFSAAEKEDDGHKEKEQDPDHMDVMEEDDNEGRGDDVERDEAEAEDEEALEEEDSKETSPSSTSELEFMEGIELEDIRTYVQCPICLGIIRKTRTVMGCLHRFCQECIDKSMRFGNHECPACRKHCASRRSLRPDPLFDAFIAATFGNINSYEDQDLAFNGDELARNKQIQATIAQVSQRQSEALVKSKSSGTDAEVLPRSQPSGSGSRRRRRNRRNMEHDTSEAHDDDDGDNNRGKDSYSAETSAEIQPRKRKRRSATRSTAHPSCPNNNDNNCASNVTEEAHHRESRGISHRFAWGRGGTRSNARQGNNNSKSVRNARLNRLVDYLGSLESNSV